MAKRGMRVAVTSYRFKSGRIPSGITCRRINCYRVSNYRITYYRIPSYTTTRMYNLMEEIHLPGRRSCQYNTFFEFSRRQVTLLLCTS